VAGIDALGARGVPGHVDHSARSCQSPGHHSCGVAITSWAPIGSDRQVLMQDRQVEPVWPPVLVAATRHAVLGVTVCDRATSLM
jgi:hypothetical protein